MRRFRFRLAQVLHVKEQRERVAEVRQQQALALRTACEAEVKALGDDLERTAATLTAKMGRPLDFAAWLATYRKSEQVGRALLAAETRAQQAVQAYEAASAQRRRLAVEAEALRQLRQQQLHAHQHAAARAEQIFLDELSLRRWQPPEAQEEEGTP